MKILAVLAVAVPLAAQSYYPRHNFTFGAGAAQPRADIATPFTNSPGISIAYGYRFHRYFQADTGLDVVFGAADIRDFFQSELFGYLRIRDYEFFIPFGGRAILPLGRLMIFGGAGGAHMRYTELLRQPIGYYRIDCPVCSTRSGWGYYALAGVNVFLDRGRHFRLGVTSRVYRGHTEGDPLGRVPGIRTRDRWIKTFGEIGFSF